MPKNTPSPFDLTGDDRWNTNGELYREYDLEPDDDEDDQKYFDDTIDGVSLDIQNDLDKGFEFSKMNQALGVKVLSGNNASQNKNGNNGDGTATYSEFSTEKLNDKFDGILPFN